LFRFSRILDFSTNPPDSEKSGPSELFPKITVLVPKTNNFRGFSRNYVISDHSFLGTRHIKRKKVLSVQSGKYTNSSFNKKDNPHCFLNRFMTALNSPNKINRVQQPIPEA